MDQDLLHKLEERLGPIHARQRLGIETDHEAQVFGQGLTFFHLENSRAAPTIIRSALKLTGLYWRARRNAERITVKRNGLRFAALPSLFEGYTILHISDMHVDMSEAAMQHLTELVDGMQYDLCVLTGDYRGKTFGPFEATLEGVVSYTGNLSPGCPCQFRSVAVRPYARWPALSAWIDPDQAGGGFAATNGGRRLAVS